MTVPDFQSILLPLLKLAAKHGEISLSDAVDTMAAHFKLSAADHAQMLPSGRNNLFRNRVAWARQYLVYATLVRPVRRGVVAITELGTKWAAERTAPLKIADFKAIPGFEQRARPNFASATPFTPLADPSVPTTPIQRIEDATARCAKPSS